MAKRLMAIPLALAVVLGAQTVCFAQAEGMDQDQTMDQNQTTGQTRADTAIHMTLDQRIADLPAGHWATNATQVAVANNILTLQNGDFNGQQPLTHAELRQAMQSMTNIAQNIAGEGALPDVHAVIANVPSDSGQVTRLEMAQTLSSFLNTLNSKQLVALGTSPASAARFKDLGANVPTAVTAVVNKYGVMTGFPDNTFRPQGTVSRYQMAAIGLEILKDMREAPVAQLPAEAPQVSVQPLPPEVIVVQPPVEEPEMPAVPTVAERPDFRSQAPIHLSWQALNATNLQAGAGAFNIIPVQGTFTGYAGPAMLQNVTNFRYDVLQSNLLNSEFRLGYADLKWGMAQFIPFVGATVGVGAAPAQFGTTGLQYDTYVGANYGAILSLMPMDNLDIHADFSQSPLLAAGRWNANFQPISYPQATGAFLSSYGLGIDFYVSPNIALTLGANTWQMPTNLRTASALTSGGVQNVYGGNIGVGFGF